MPWSQLSHILGLEKGGALRGALGDIWTGLLGGSEPPARSVGFTIAVVALCAKMAKADGVALRLEADAFERHFAVDAADMPHVRRLFDLAKQDVSGFEIYADQIARQLADEPALLGDLLECLFHIAAADGVLHVMEDRFLQTVAERFGIPAPAYQRMRSMFVRDPDDPYLVLGADRTDSNEALKSHHRSLVMEHHPDRLVARGVPAAFVALAEAKLAAINAAWDAIRKERGL